MVAMDQTQLINETKTKLATATEHLRGELSKIRTGRAHPGMLDSVQVEAYGQTMPLKAAASIAAPEPQLLQITPFDPNNLQAISDAISNSQSLGLNPSDDGRVVRIQIPPLTEETRKQMVRVVNQKLEECLITARNIRHDALHQAEAAEKAKQIGKDDLERTSKQIDELLAKQKSETEALARTKESEILTV